MEGKERNTRDPSAQPKSGQGASYKPKAKSNVVQRESEGIEVLHTAGEPAGTKAVKNNAVGGKGPWGDRAVRVGKREGMAGKTGPNVSARATAFFANDSGLGRAALRLTASEAWINRVLA